MICYPAVSRRIRGLCFQSICGDKTLVRADPNEFVSSRCGPVCHLPSSAVARSEKHVGTMMHLIGTTTPENAEGGGFPDDEDLQRVWKVQHEQRQAVH